MHLLQIGVVNYDREMTIQFLITILDDKYYLRLQPQIFTNSASAGDVGSLISECLWKLYKNGGWHELKQIVFKLIKMDTSNVLQILRHRCDFNFYVQIFDILIQVDPEYFLSNISISGNFQNRIHLVLSQQHFIICNLNINFCNKFIYPHIVLLLPSHSHYINPTIYIFYHLSVVYI